MTPYHKNLCFRQQKISYGFGFGELSSNENKVIVTSNHKGKTHTTVTLQRFGAFLVRFCTITRKFDRDRKSVV